MRTACRITVRLMVALPVVAVGVAVAVPLLLPVVAVAGCVRGAARARQRAAANRARCVAYGAALGTPAVRRADEDWRRYMTEALGRQPGVKLRLCRTCHAVCPACGARHTYRSTNRRFVAEARVGQTGWEACVSGRGGHD